MPLALLAAFIGSLSLHATALFLPDIDLSTAPEPPPLTAELKPLPPPPAAEPEARKPVEPSPKPRPPRPKVARAAPAAVPVPGEEPPPSPQAEEAVSPAPPEPPPAVLPPGEPRLPTSGRIRFAVYRGERGFQVGRAEHAWTFADGAYRLTAVTETSGLAALFKPVRIELESRGRITAQGLQPEQFTTRRNGAATNENAEFDWSAQQVTLARNGSRHPLREGAQDLLSFHYQLGYLAGLAEGASMGVASGRKFERYNFDSVGEEEIDTPAGRFRTLHLRVQTDSTTELWLALDRLMLPVKIRHTDRKGESFEQVATELGTP